MNIDIKTLITEEEIEKEFFENLKQKRLDEKFFYRFPISVNAWFDLCNSKEYKNYSRSYNMSIDISQDVCNLINGDKIDWISFGVGDGAKEIIFLKELNLKGRDIFFKPVDYSIFLLERACNTSQKNHIRTIGYKADFTNNDHINKIIGNENNRTKVFSLLGNTLGAFKQNDLLKQIKDVMNEDDYLLVDGEIYDDKTTYSGYQNQSNLKFVMGPIYSIGINESDGKLILDMEKDPERKGFYRIYKYFKFSKNKSIKISCMEINYKSGDRLKMSYSYKYDYNEFISLLKDEIGFNIVKTYFSEDKNYVFALCSKQRRFSYCFYNKY